MDPVVALVISIAPALAAMAYAWKIVRAERRRQVARIDALRQAASLDDDVDAPSGFAGSAGKADVRGGPREAPVAESASSVGRLFGQGNAATESGLGRVPIFAALFVVVALAAFAWSGSPASSTSATATAPLELLSLRHEQTESNVRITGLVRNPVEAGTRQGVHVAVLFFDRAGTFLDSAGGRLEFDPLGSGEETPFVVSAPRSKAAARYRVSFRVEGVGAIPHVDRRLSESPSALEGGLEEREP